MRCVFRQNALYAVRLHRCNELGIVNLNAANDMVAYKCAPMCIHTRIVRQIPHVPFNDAQTLVGMFRG